MTCFDHIMSLPGYKIDNRLLSKIVDKIQENEQLSREFQATREDKAREFQDIFKEM